MDDSKIRGRIIGGENVKENNSYPFMATFWYLDGPYYKFKAGAIWIGGPYFLTAAHCVYERDVRMIMIRMGDVHLEKQSVELRVSVIVIHPDFKRATLENDIAIIQAVESPTNRFPNLIPVILPSNKYKIDYNTKTQIKILGYGRETFEVLPNQMKHLLELRELDIIIISKDKTNYKKIPKNMFVAGNIINGVCVDSCIGDSGGPCLQFIGGIWVLVGIISCGVGCGNLSYPGMYTKVQPFYSWIMKLFFPTTLR